MTDTPLLEGERILVTGASGFLGRSLCPRLQASGAQVHGVSRHRQEATAGIDRWWQADCADHAQVKAVMTQVQPHVVFHLGGYVTADGSAAHVEPTVRSLLLSTIYLLEAVAESSCRRLLLVGSLTEPVGPATQAVPTSPYAAAKLAAGVYGRMFHRLYGTPTVIVRPFMAYGPGQRDTKVIPTTIRALLRGEAPRLASGRFTSDWIYVSDVIDGMIAAAAAPGVEGLTFEFGSGTVASVETIVREIVSLMGLTTEPQFGAHADRPDEPERGAADLTLASTRLNWAPRVSRAEGLRLTIDDFAAKARAWTDHSVPQGR